MITEDDEPLAQVEFPGSAYCRFFPKNKGKILSVFEANCFFAVISGYYLAVFCDFVWRVLRYFMWSKRIT